MFIASEIFIIATADLDVWQNFMVMCKNGSTSFVDVTCFAFTHSRVLRISTQSQGKLKQ